MVPEKKTHAHVPILAPCQNIAIATITTLAQTMVPQEKTQTIVPEKKTCAHSNLNSMSKHCHSNNNNTSTKNGATEKKRKKHAHVAILTWYQNIVIATMSSLS